MTILMIGEIVCKTLKNTKKGFNQSDKLGWVKQFEGLSALEKKKKVWRSETANEIIKDDEAEIVLTEASGGLVKASGCLFKRDGAIEKY